MAEIEIGVMSRQALWKPLPDLESFKQQVRVWTVKRNTVCVKINWQFNTQDARIKLVKLYPTIVLKLPGWTTTAIEQCYFILSQIWEIIGSRCPGLDHDALIVAGDSVGGNMAVAMALMAQERNGPKIQKQLLYYPVTNACFDTPSYRQFAVNYYLYRAGMQWFWEQYTCCKADRTKITASPLLAGMDCLRKIPDTMIINGQADVLRSEGQVFRERLRCAGVNVTALCIQGIIHDFVMLNALDQTTACRMAMDVSTAWINGALPSPSPICGKSSRLDPLETQVLPDSNT